MYVLVSSPFDSAAVVFHIEDSSIEEKLAFEKLCESIKARQGKAMWREVCKIMRQYVITMHLQGIHKHSLKNILDF